MTENKLSCSELNRWDDVEDEADISLKDAESPNHIDSIQSGVVENLNEAVPSQNQHSYDLNILTDQFSRLLNFTHLNVEITRQLNQLKNEIGYAQPTSTSMPPPVNTAAVVTEFEGSTNLHQQISSDSVATQTPPGTHDLFFQFLEHTTKSHRELGESVLHKNAEVIQMTLDTIREIGILKID